MKVTGGTRIEAGVPREANPHLLAALAGKEAGRERDVARRTRCVIAASLGVMRDQQAVCRRGRAVALAAVLMVVLVLGPLLWRVVDQFIAGARLTDMNIQISLLLCILCPALLAAALLAGWMRKPR